MEPVVQKPITHWNEIDSHPASVDLIAEEPLSIRVEGQPYAVVMRTPGDELAHAAGFCLTEGIADQRADIAGLSFCGDDTNVVAVTLTPERRHRIAGIMDRRGYISQTSCGICGKSVVEDLRQEIAPVSRPASVNLAASLHRLEQLADHQPLRRETRATHAAALFSGKGDLLATAEDLGRHNALDKAIGKLFLDDDLHRAASAVLSSRLSYELVQKAARAGIPAVVSMSRPTALAVQLASELGMALACRARGVGMYIFSDPRGVFF